MWDIAGLLSPQSGFGDPVEEILTFVFNLLDMKGSSEQLRGSIPLLLWNIWKNRNAILYAGTQESLHIVE